MNRDDYQKGIRKAFGNPDESDEEKRKREREAAAARKASREARRTPAQEAERNRKIARDRGYEDGGVCKESDKKKRIEVLAKLAKSRKKRK